METYLFRDVAHEKTWVVNAPKELREDVVFRKTVGRSLLTLKDEIKVFADHKGLDEVHFVYATDFSIS